ncbi:MAG: VOC family protein [Alphaproteobacteria bacterium]|nr:VOC family protein [Alphaproteobacteria bacterium]
MANGRVLGIGGVFSKSPAPAARADWYRRVLGLDPEPGGAVVFTAYDLADRVGAMQILAPFPADTDYFAPSTAPFMINLVVDDLAAMLARAAAAGVVPVWRDDDGPQGRFAHLIDPDGIKIELWEPRGL